MNISCKLIQFIITLLVILLGIVAYVASGISILIEEYNYGENCEGSSLQNYVLVSLLLILPRFICIQKYDRKDIYIILSLVLIILIELNMIIWGGFELFDKAQNCPGLDKTNLWNHGLASFIIQFIVLITVFSRLLYIIYKKKFIKKIPITDIEVNNQYGSAYRA